MKCIKRIIPIIIVLIMSFLIILFALWLNQKLNQKFEEGKAVGIEIGYEKYIKENWVPEALYIKEYPKYPIKSRNRELQEKFKG